MNGAASHRAQLAVKRALDTTAAGVGLVLVAPLLGGVGLLVRWDSPGPVLFRQDRAGRNGTIFRVLKIRTMTVGVPAIPGASRADLDAMRITRVGRILRRTAIDELPQLVNVLRGEMSLIGPRPDLPHHVDRYDAAQRGRLTMRPGLTGWAQVHGRNDISWDARIALDLAYVRHWSLVLDVRIVVLTLRILVSGRGAALAGVTYKEP